MVSLPASLARQASFLDAADRIGAQLADAAIWYAGRCNWVGARFEQEHGLGDITHASLGPDLYAGTSGVAVFLANLAAVTGDRGLRRTALGLRGHRSFVANGRRTPAADDVQSHEKRGSR